MTTQTSSADQSDAIGAAAREQLKSIIARIERLEDAVTALAAERAIAEVQIELCLGSRENLVGAGLDDAQDAPRRAAPQARPGAAHVCASDGADAPEDIKR